MLLVEVMLGMILRFPLLHYLYSIVTEIKRSDLKVKAIVIRMYDPVFDNGKKDYYDLHASRAID